MKLIKSALNILLPQQCLLCMSASSAPICEHCHPSLPLLGLACQRCALPLKQAVAQCGRCLSKPPSFDASRAAFYYAAPVNKLISQFKHGGHLSAGRLLEAFLVERIRRDWNPDDPLDLVTAVPLHWTRQLRRSFNQSAFLAESLARQFRLPFVQVVRRRFATPKQQALSRKQRLRNLRNAFSADAPLVEGRSIVIVDDVLTTGATAEALSRTLKRAGARRVEIWALARTPQPGTGR